MSRASEATNIEKLCTVAVRNACEQVRDVEISEIRPTIYSLGFMYVRGVESAVEALKDAEVPRLGSTYKGCTVTSLVADCIADKVWKVWISGH